MYLSPIIHTIYYGTTGIYLLWRNVSFHLLHCTVSLIFNNRNYQLIFRFAPRVYMKFQKLGEKLEFVDFPYFIIVPVSNPFTNYCTRRRHRIKILKTIRSRYRNYLDRMVFRFPIYSTGPM